MEHLTPPGLAFLDSALRDAEARGLLRRRAAPPGPATLSFCSNDYLSLAARRAPAEACGAGASRLVDGERGIHGALERAAAEWVGQADALAFVSGYAANSGVLPALAGPGDLILSDALNHASLIDGARLSRARVVVFPHLDVAAVARALDGNRHGRVFVVTESYFSMDADAPDLAGLRRLCDAHGAALVVDEAHALGILGPDGRGLCAQADVRPDVTMGTFGKAFGASGAFVAGCHALTQWLWNRARPFVFSTGMSPVVAAAARDGMRIARAEPDRRQRALAAAARFREGMVTLGLRVAGFGQVMPWVLGDPRDAMAAAEELQARGIDVRAIRPPSVPVGTARLRFTVTAAHATADVDRALEAIASLPAARSRPPRPAAAQDVTGVRASSSHGAGRLVVIAGTGTGIGKTHVAEALVRHWAATEGAGVIGIKPIESGVIPGTTTDAVRLASASPFHVKHARYALSAPISPHLAAREENVTLDPAAIAASVDSVRAQARIVVLELAGGLFTPLSASLSNAELAAALAPDAVVLVAPDRLGVLHDVAASVRAASTVPLRIDGVVLVAPPEPDASTSRNAHEIGLILGVPWLATVPRATSEDLAAMPFLAALATRLSASGSPLSHSLSAI